ncbi:MAG: hypothetical protein WCL02_06015 [bacterium]
MDNHNHALSFRYQHTKSYKNNDEAKPFVVIHIDQHADTKPNNEIIRGNIEHFVHEKTNVGNFISAARNNTIIDEVVQIRSEYALHNIQKLNFLEYNYIIDIDIDFWEGKTDKEIQTDISIIKTLIKNACLITIATSPYFIDQKRALEIIHMMLQ